MKEEAIIHEKKRNLHKLASRRKTHCKSSSYHYKESCPMTKTHVTCIEVKHPPQIIQTATTVQTRSPILNLNQTGLIRTINTNIIRTLHMLLTTKTIANEQFTRTLMISDSTHKSPTRKLTMSTKYR